MRWVVWNLVGCVLWLAGLAYAQGMSLVGAMGSAADGHQAATGFGFGIVGLLLLMWVNLLDA